MRLPLFAAVLLAIASLSAYADTTFVYTGNPYTQPFSPFNTSQFVSGSFTISGSLAPNLNGFEDVALESYSFTDGA